MLQLREVVDGTARADDLFEHLDAFVGTVASDDLCAEQAARAGSEEKLDRERQRIWIVAGVRSTVRVRRDVFDAVCLQKFGVGSGRGYRQVENLGNRGADRTLVGVGVAQYDVVGHDAALFVGRACQWNQGRAACDQMAHLDGVAQGVDLRVGGLHVFIDGDAAALAQHEPRFLGESGLGSYADT